MEESLAKGEKKSSRLFTSCLRRALHRRGLDITVPMCTAWYNDAISSSNTGSPLVPIPAAPPSMTRHDDDHHDTCGGDGCGHHGDTAHTAAPRRDALLIGNTRAMWPLFTAYMRRRRSSRPSLDTTPAPTVATPIIISSPPSETTPSPPHRINTLSDDITCLGDVKGIRENSTSIGNACLSPPPRCDSKAALPFTDPNQKEDNDDTLSSSSYRFCFCSECDTQFDKDPLDAFVTLRVHKALLEAFAEARGDIQRPDREEDGKRERGDDSHHNHSSIRVRDIYYSHEVSPKERLVDFQKLALCAFNRQQCRHQHRAEEEDTDDGERGGGGQHGSQINNQIMCEQHPTLFMCFHREYGSWFGLRALVVFSEGLEWEETSPPSPLSVAMVETSQGEGSNRSASRVSNEGSIGSILSRLDPEEVSRAEAMMGIAMSRFTAGRKREEEEKEKEADENERNISTSDCPKAKTLIVDATSPDWQLWEAIRRAISFRSDAYAYSDAQLKYHCSKDQRYIYEKE